MALTELSVLGTPGPITQFSTPIETTVDSALLTLSGIAVSTQHLSTVSPATLELDGVLTGIINAPVSAASFLLDGISVGTKHSTNVAAANVALSGVVPQGNIITTADVAILSLSGVAAATTHRVSLDSASMSLAGVSVATAHRIELAPSTLILTGRVPDVVSATSAPTAEFSLLVGSVSIARTYAIGTASIEFVCVRPFVDITGQIERGCMIVTAAAEYDMVTSAELEYDMVTEAEVCSCS